MVSTSTPSSSAFARTVLGQGFHLCIRFFQGIDNIGFCLTFILPERLHLAILLWFIPFGFWHSVSALKLFRRVAGLTRTSRDFRS